MIPTLIIITLIVLGWYWFEGRWDRKLFKTTADRVCVNIRAKAAKAFLEAHSDAQVLDVRSDAEFSGGALPHAIHISLGDPAFVEKLGQLDKAKPILVYCAGGFRSRKAVEMMKPLGFSNIQHLHRGYMSWRSAGLPVGRSGVGE